MRRYKKRPRGTGVAGKGVVIWKEKMKKSDRSDGGEEGRYFSSENSVVLLWWDLIIFMQKLLDLLRCGTPGTGL